MTINNRPIPAIIPLTMPVMMLNPAMSLFLKLGLSIGLLLAVNACAVSPYETAFSSCDDRVGICYRNCETYANDADYGACQASCERDAEVCFDRAYSQYRVVSGTAVTFYPFYGTYAYWYPNRGFVSRYRPRGHFGYGHRGIRPVRRPYVPPRYRDQRPDRPRYDNPRRRPPRGDNPRRRPPRGDAPGRRRPVNPPPSSRPRADRPVPKRRVRPVRPADRPARPPRSRPPRRGDRPARPPRGGTRPARPPRADRPARGNRPASRPPKRTRPPRSRPSGRGKPTQPKVPDKQ